MNRSLNELRELLQDSLFRHGEEQIVALCRVYKSDKVEKEKDKDGKKKLVFKKNLTEGQVLCLCLKRGRSLRLHKVKPADKDSKSFNLKRTWRMEDLTEVDGPSADGTDFEFTLHLEKPYRWTALRVPERNAFLYALMQLCSQHIPVQPRIIALENVQLGLVDMQVENETIADTVEETDSGTVQKVLLLTPAEEKEVESLLQSRDWGKEAEAVADYLANDVEELESANVYALIESDHAVEAILEKLTLAESQLESMDKWLSGYEPSLQEMRRNIARIESKNNRMEVQARNHKLLLDEVNQLLNNLLLPDNAERALQDPQFDDMLGLQQAIVAAQKLRRALQYRPQEGMQEMSAVRDQQTKFEKLRKEFAFSCKVFVEETITKRADAWMSRKARKAEIVSPDHGEVHTDLVKLAPLVEWLKDMDPKSYRHVRKTYRKAFEKAYQRDISDFFSGVTRAIGKEHREHRITSLVSGEVPPTPSPTGGGSTPDSHGHAPPLSRSASELRQSSSELKRSGSELSDGSMNSSNRSLYGDKMPVDKVFAAALDLGVPACLHEQQFLEQFFAVTDADELEDEEMKGESVSETHVIPHLMSVLLSSMSDGFISMIKTADKIDPMYVHSMLGPVERRIPEMQNKSHFLVGVLTLMAITQKQIFNEFINKQVDALEAVKSQTKQVGVFACFKRYPFFLRQLKSQETGIDLTLINSVSLKLSAAMFAWLERTASTDPKYADIVRSENYHHFFTTVEPLGLACLQESVDNARRNYTKALDHYVEWILSSELGEFLSYFEGMERISRDLGIVEVQFQTQFRKEKFRALIKRFQPLWEKSLKNMYKRMEKHLSVEENLLGVAWNDLKDILIGRFNLCKELTAQCYQTEELVPTVEELSALAEKTPQTA